MIFRDICLSMIVWYMFLVKFVQENNRRLLEMDFHTSVVLFWLDEDFPNYSFLSINLVRFCPSRRSDIQSTLVISKSKGLSEILRDIRTSTCQICRLEEKYNSNNHISQMNMLFDSLS